MVIHDVNLDTMDKDLEGNRLFKSGYAFSYNWPVGLVVFLFRVKDIFSTPFFIFL